MLWIAPPSMIVISVFFSFSVLNSTSSAPFCLHEISHTHVDNVFTSRSPNEDKQTGEYFSYLPIRISRQMGRLISVWTTWKDAWPSSLVVRIVCVYHQAFDVNVYLRSFFFRCDQSKNDESVTWNKKWHWWVQCWFYY